MDELNMTQKDLKRTKERHNNGEEIESIAESFVARLEKLRTEKYKSPNTQGLPVIRFDDRYDFEEHFQDLIFGLEKPTLILINGFVEFVAAPLDDPDGLVYDAEWELYYK